MKKYIRNYLKYYNIGEQDWVACKVCNGTSVDLHHIKLKSAGGSDEVDNLIPLCRKCHDQAHFKTKPYLTEEELYDFNRTT